MAQVHMTAAQVVKDFKAVLEKVQRGAEVIVEEHARPVAVIRSAQRTGRPISECIAMAKSRGSNATLDEGFSEDMEEVIRGHQEPWNPPFWE